MTFVRYSLQKKKKHVLLLLFFLFFKLAKELTEESKNSPFSCSVPVSLV
jgi:hypothetical protein